MSQCCHDTSQSSPSRACYGVSTERQGRSGLGLKARATEQRQNAPAAISESSRGIAACGLFSDEHEVSGLIHHAVIGYLRDHPGQSEALTRSSSEQCRCFNFHCRLKISEHSRCSHSGKRCYSNQRAVTFHYHRSLSPIPAKSS